MPSPYQVNVVITLTCTLCGGPGYYETKDDGLCNCPRCERGKQVAEVPLSVLLNASRPEMSPADTYEVLAAHIQANPGGQHSCLANLMNFIPEKVLAERRNRRRILPEGPV